MDMNIRLEGMRELEASLQALQKEYGGKAAAQALRPAIRSAISPVLSEVQQATPVDSGTLSTSSKVKIGKPTRKMGSSEHYSSQTVIYGQVGWFWSGESLWNQALAVEFGTGEQPAQSILRNIHERESRAMLRRFGDTLGPAIEKKAKSLARRRARG